MWIAGQRNHGSTAAAGGTKVTQVAGQAWDTRCSREHPSMGIHMACAG